jgi:hypothetical protein
MAEHATREEIERLRTEILHLRRQQQPVDTAQLVDTMEQLHRILEKLVTMFETANKEVYAEYEKGFHDEQAKLDKLLEQNEKLARAIVALADMVKQPTRAPQGMPPLPAKPSFPPTETFMAQPVTPLTPPSSAFPGMPPLPPVPQPEVPARLPPLPPMPERTSSPRRNLLEKFSFK